MGKQRRTEKELRVELDYKRDSKGKMSEIVENEGYRENVGRERLRDFE
jgi:hypothetical protein